MSADNFAIATERLLAPAGIEERHLTGVLGTIMGHAVDNADLYFQVSRHESWTLEDGIVKEGAHSIGRGRGRDRPGHGHDGPDAI